MWEMGCRQKLPFELVIYKAFKKSHKVFVLTCGYVLNCGFWVTKNRIATMFFAVHILFLILINLKFCMRYSSNIFVGFASVTNIIIVFIASPLILPTESILPLL